MNLLKLMAPNSDKSTVKQGEKAVNPHCRNKKTKKNERFLSLPRAEDGAAMLEFALILPMLLLMLIGGIEVTRLVLFHQKIDNATSQVANVVTQLNQQVVQCNGPNGLNWMRDPLMKQFMQPYNFTADGSMIISAVEGKYPNLSDPNRDRKPVRQVVAWQWKSGGAASNIASKGGLAKGSGWPASFRRSPNRGGMFNGERVIAVEVFFNYKPLFPFTASLTKIEIENSIYKNAFYRSRFGNMANLKPGC